MRALVKLAIISTVFLWYSCKKSDPTPVPPKITFIDAQIAPGNTHTVVNFEFFDGDGDLGLRQNENTGDQEFNVFVDYYELNNGVWELKSPIVDSTFNFNTNQWEYNTQYFHVRMPYIENENKLALEGDIEVNLFFNNFKFAQTSKADTFRYELSIKDRALHTSNVITTSELVME